ncbi:hypothetical protein M8J75_002143 [Diaphorina citri]|nr:hypothetical protein M8J75_002143 [Diaphorina citri]
MHYDESDDEVVSYATFQRYRDLYPDTSPIQTPATLIVEISSHAEPNTENHLPSLAAVLQSDSTTEEMVSQFEKYTLRNISEKELIKILVKLITRFQKHAKTDSRIHLPQLIACLNDVRLLLVILSKKTVANEFVHVYRLPVWRYLKSYLKYLSGLIKLDPAAATIGKYGPQLAHLFQTLGHLFQVKTMDEDLHLEFSTHLVHLFFSATTPDINQAISGVICIIISKYDWLDIYLYDIYKYDTDQDYVRTLFPFSVQGKKMTLHSISMLLVQIIDHEIRVGLADDIRILLHTLFVKVHQIASLALKYNQSALVTLLGDLSKMTGETASIPRPGLVLLQYFLFLQTREMMIADRLHSNEHGPVIDAYFDAMARVCVTFKSTQKKADTLTLTSDVIYELLDHVDRTDQFTLMSFMFGTTMLSKQPLSDEDKNILNYSSVTYTELKPAARTKRGKGKTSVAPVSRDPKRVLKRDEIPLAFNYFLQERLQQTVLMYYLQTVLSKIKNSNSPAAVARHLKYLSNLQRFCTQSYPVLEEKFILNIMSVMYDVIKSSEHKVAQQIATNILCEFCARRSSLYEMYKRALCVLLCQTESVHVMRTLCGFYTDKFQRENEHLALIAPVEDTEVQDDTEVQPLDMQFTVVHALVVRLSNPTFKPTILNFFSKFWFDWETQSSKLDHKVDQMIKLVSLNWRDELEELIREIFHQSKQDSKSTLLCAKQIVYNVMQRKKDNTMAWEVVLYFSNVKSNILVEYFGELNEIVKHTILQRDIGRLRILEKIISNIISENKESIDITHMEDFKAFLFRVMLVQVPLDVKVVCIELMRFCDIEDKSVLKYFAKMYKKIKERLENLVTTKGNAKIKLEDRNNNLDTAKANVKLEVEGKPTALETSKATLHLDEIYSVTQFFGDIFILSAWLYNWPQVIIQCDQYSSVHTEMVHNICTLYAYTESQEDRQCAVRSLGKIHCAFPELVNSKEVLTLYRDILKSGDDHLKYLAITNIYLHIKQARNLIDRASSKPKSGLKLKTMDHGILDEASTTANLYLEPILSAYYTIPHPTIRSIVPKFLMANLNFGTLVAHQIVEHMIAMLSDEDFHTTGNVSQELQHWNKMDPTLLINGFRKGVVHAYKLERLINVRTTPGETKDANNNKGKDANNNKAKDANNNKANTTEDPLQIKDETNKRTKKFTNESLLTNADRAILRGYRLDRNMALPKLQLFFQLIQKNSVPFLKMLVKQLEEAIKTPSSPGLFVYLIDNVTTFPYNTLPELRAVLYELDVIEKVQGFDILEEHELLGNATTLDRQTYRVYLRMAQLNLFIQLKQFLWKKYALPRDLIHNKRYEKVKLKTKLVPGFNQSAALESISENVLLCSVNTREMEKFKADMARLKANITKEVVKMKDSDESEDDNLKLTYDEYIVRQARETEEQTNVENMAESGKVDQRGTTATQPKNNRAVALNAKPELSKNSKPRTVTDKNSDHSTVQKNARSSMVVQKDTASNDTQKSTHENRTRTKKSQVSQKAEVDERKEKNSKKPETKTCITNINVDDNNNISLFKNDKSLFNNNTESGTKKSYKDLYKLNRPIPPHIIEKAKQANIEWMIDQPGPSGEQRGISSQKVQFNTFNETYEYDMDEPNSQDANNNSIEAINQSDMKGKGSQSIKDVTNQIKLTTKTPDEEDMVEISAGRDKTNKQGEINKARVKTTTLRTKTRQPLLQVHLNTNEKMDEDELAQPTVEAKRVNKTKGKDQSVKASRKKTEEIAEIKTKKSQMKTKESQEKSDIKLKKSQEKLEEKAQTLETNEGSSNGKIDRTLASEKKISNIEQTIDEVITNQDAVTNDGKKERNQRIEKKNDISCDQPIDVTISQEKGSKNKGKTHKQPVEKKAFDLLHLEQTIDEVINNFERDMSIYAKKMNKSKGLKKKSSSNHVPSGDDQEGTDANNKTNKGNDDKLGACEEMKNINSGVDKEKIHSKADNKNKMKNKNIEVDSKKTIKSKTNVANSKDKMENVAKIVDKKEKMKTNVNPADTDDSKEKMKKKPKGDITNIDEADKSKPKREMQNIDKEVNNNVEDDDDEDFINENRKRIKCQIDTNRKKGRNLVNEKMSKVDSTRKASDEKTKRKQAKLKMVGLMQNLLISSKNESQRESK